MDYYKILTKIMEEEFEQGRDIAIFPLGRIGLYAKNILENRYGKKGVYIDNKISKYNDEVITLEEFAGKYENDESTTVIVSTDCFHLSYTLQEDLERLVPNCIIRNVFSIHKNEEKTEKKDYFDAIRKICNVKKEKTYDLIRLGRPNDGGYVLLNNLEDINLAYSFGISEDISFELMASSWDINFYCYDHTIKCLPFRTSKLNYQKIGIAGQDISEKNLMSLPTLIKNNGHEGTENMLLKMDVEGAEWEFIEKIPSGILKQFDQMIFEFHDILEMPEETVINAFRKIAETHQCIWVHGNNWSYYESAGNMSMPNCIEMTFVNKDTHEFDECDYNIPTELDMPNLSSNKEINIDNWND